MIASIGEMASMAPTAGGQCKRIPYQALKTSILKNRYLLRSPFAYTLLTYAIQIIGFLNLLPKALKRVSVIWSGGWLSSDG